MKKVYVFLLAFWIASASVQAADVVYSWNRNEKKIALTFDDGPHPVHTPEILDILAEYGIHATFFVIGQNLEYYDDLLKLEVEAGHEIGNHTYSHKNLLSLEPVEVYQEIDNTEKLVYEQTSYKTHLLRPPEGKLGDNLCRMAQEKAYTVVCWSVDTRDWAHTSTEEIVRHVLSSVEGGDIILFHDFVSGESPTPEALRRIIPALLEEGFEFVTVSELIETE